MKVLKSIGKVALIVLVSIIGVVALVIGGLNVAKYSIYNEYYSIKTNICNNPGLSDDFVCQGIAASEENDVFIVSGYMKNKTNSRIYITNEENASYYVKLERNGKVFTGHVGGIAITGDNVYIANGKKIYTVSLSDILNAKNGDIIDVGDGVSVNNSASFVYTDETYLYVGEFHDGGAYVTDHPYETNEGTNYAIVSRYKLTDLPTPDKVYSIRNKVQGICFTPDGRVIMSTSYGLTDTIYYIYNEAEATDSGKTLDGAPVYYLDKLVDKVKGPAMGEDLDYYNGKIITLTESASNKYIFGKLFGADKIVGLEF